MSTRNYLGLDLGSVSLDAVVVDESGMTLWSAYRTVRGRSRDAVVSLCRELLEGWLRPGKVTAFDGVTAAGSGKEVIQELLDVPAVNEIVAHGTAASRFAAGVVRLKELLDQKLFDVRLPNVKLSEMRMPHVKLPDVRLPGSRWGWKRKERGWEEHDV